MFIDTYLYSSKEQVAMTKVILVISNAFIVPFVYEVDLFVFAHILNPAFKFAMEIVNYH